MSAFQEPLSPPLESQTKSTSLSLPQKQEQDFIENTISLSKKAPLDLLTSPKTTARGYLTPPDSAVKTEHATGTTYKTATTSISKASFLLAQASLATGLFGGPSTTEFKFSSPTSSESAGPQTLRFGTGLDGCFSRTRGFLGAQEQHQNHDATGTNNSSGSPSSSAGSSQRLPASLEAWEVVHASLPRLLRAGRVRIAVDALDNIHQGCAAGQRDAWDDLKQRHLARAALVLSALAHAYMFGEERGTGKEGRPQLPRHVLGPWARVCTNLGRPLTGRVPADDVLNNAVGNASFSLTSTYFGLPEERLSAGLQGTMEAVFAPALSAMALAQSGVLADQPDLVAHCLENLASRIVKCGFVFQAMTPRDAAHFDPVVWIKTYPAMGRAVTSGELGNSGVDAPLFHALDAFIGRQSVRGDLSGMQNDRRATLPANIRAFLDALGDWSVSVRDYVAAACDRQQYQAEKPQYRRVSAAWDGLLQIYLWFLERHRVKAVGITGVSLNTGRHSTSSGVSSGDHSRSAAGKTKMRPETMLSMQMKAGMASRLGGRPLWQDAYVESRKVYQGSVVVTVRLDAILPLEPGDRVQVWPPRKRKKVSSLHQRRSHSREWNASSPELPELHDTSSSESDDDAEPRFYSISIASVMPHVSHRATDSGEGGGGGMTITLTVSQHSPEGLVSSFLGTATRGTHLRLRPWPSPNFRQPRDPTVPLIMVGQGSGVGPFVGFLHERVEWAQRLNNKQDNIGDVGVMLLVVAAKTRRHVPCPMDRLERLTRALPLTIILALSQEAHFMIRSGTWTQLPDGEGRITHHSLEHLLVEQRNLIQRLVKEQGGHVFVCGSSDFGAMVMRSLAIDQPQQQQVEDASDEDYDNNHTNLPPPPPHWDQMHLDLFTSVVKRRYISRSPSRPSSLSRRRSSSIPTRPGNTIISLSTLAAHNSISSCWTAIHGIVYDVTSFLTTHPGGPKTLLESAGTVADARFAETHGGPHAQEIKGYLQGLAIGRLSTAIVDTSNGNEDTFPSSAATQTTTARLLDALVRMQNALTNNTVFTEGRGTVPMYVYADSLLVFADGLDGVVGILSGCAFADGWSELRDSLVSTQVLLRKAFVVLKEGCKSFLVAAGSKASGSSSKTLLDESEDLIRRLYNEPIMKVHAATDACKEALGKICDAYEDENGNAPKHALEEFGISLTSVAKDLLY